MAEADGGDFGRDVLEGVVDGEAGGDAAAGGVDVQVDGFGGGVGFEEEEGGGDGGGHAVVDFTVDSKVSGGWVRWGGVGWVPVDGDDALFQ